MTVGFLTWGLRMALRHLRSGVLTPLALALALTVAVLTAVGTLSERIQAGLQRDARVLLGGDAVLVGDAPLPPEFAQQARRLGLRTSHSESFPTMASAGDAVRLVALKAVDAAYPLRGALRLEFAPGRAPDAPTQAPARDEVWVESGVLEALGLRLGDSLGLGGQTFKVGARLLEEPDRGMGFMAFAPRVMMSRDALPATGLIQPASRVHYRLMVAGDDAAALDRYTRWAGLQVAASGVRGLRVDTLQSGRPEVSGTLERATTFFQLVALLAALLCALALALAARGAARALLDEAALLRVWGLRRRTLAAALAVELAALALGVGAVGAVLGYGAHLGLMHLLAQTLRADLPPTSGQPAALALGLGALVLFGVGWTALWRVADVPPLRVLRRDLHPPLSRGWLAWALPLGALLALLQTLGAQRTLGLLVLGGLVGAGLVYAALAAGLGWILRQWARSSALAPAWAAALRMWLARPGLLVLQVGALSLGLSVLLVLALLRAELIERWRASVPADAPDRFVINILPDQAQAFQARLQAAGVSHYDWFAMLRGRLVAINDAPVHSEQAADERSRRLLEREFNLSFTPDLPQHNTLVAGQWQAEAPDAISVEQGLADALGLRLGDRLSFEIGAQTISARITSLRRVQWGSLRANFFVLFPRARMDEWPHTYLAAYRQPSGAGLDAALQHAFPAITSVDLSAALAQVQRLVGQLTLAVQALFAFTLAAGVLVLFNALRDGAQARAHELAVWRALGARRAQVRRVLGLEWLGTGVLAGALAGATAQGLMLLLARRLFDFDWGLSWRAWLIAVVLGAGLSAWTGWWAQRRVWHTPVWATLRATQVT